MKLTQKSFFKLDNKTALLLIILVLILDQASKIYIKLHYPLSVYGGPAIIDWGFFKLLLIENKGMAWGTKISDILAGAIGNIIDSVFYGVWFSHSYGQIAEFMPDQGYADLFYGHVVDMLQFPLATWVWPQWLPFVGGETYTFFEYVFNIADFAISCGVGILLFFNKRIFG